MADDNPEARRLQERVRAVLRLAKRGKTAQQLATELGKYQPRRGTSRRAYYDWDNDPSSLSAVALVAAIELAGQDVADVLLPPRPRPRPGESFDQMITRMEETIATVSEELAAARQEARDSNPKQRH